MVDIGDGKASVNFDRLRSVVTHLVINLNKIIATSYPTKKTVPLQEARPIGVGSSGTADVFTAMGVSLTARSRDRTHHVPRHLPYRHVYVHRSGREVR
jgi:hypothetical protein